MSFEPEEVEELFEENLATASGCREVFSRKSDAYLRVVFGARHVKAAGLMTQRQVGADSWREYRSWHGRQFGSLTPGTSGDAPTGARSRTKRGFDQRARGVDVPATSRSERRHLNERRRAAPAQPD